MATRKTGEGNDQGNIFKNCFGGCLKFLHVFFEFQKQLLRGLLGSMRMRRPTNLAATAVQNKSQKKNGYKKVEKEGGRRPVGKFVKNGGSPTKPAVKSLNISEDLESGEGDRKMPSPSENDRLLIEWADSSGRQYKMEEGSLKKIDVIKIFGETKKYKEITFLSQDNSAKGPGSSAEAGRGRMEGHNSLGGSKIRIRKMIVARPSDDSMPFTNLKLSNYEGINLGYLDMLEKQGKKESILGAEDPIVNKLNSKAAGLLNAFGNRRRRVMMNLFKKKKPHFTPSKLTTIYENLAY